MEPVAALNAALAKTEIETEKELFNEELQRFGVQKVLHARKTRHRACQRYWKMVASKRDRFRLVADKVDLLARLSSYMMYAWLTIYVNQNPPSIGEFPLAEWIITCWGCMCVLCCTMHLLILMVSNLIHVAIMNLSAKEDLIDEPRYNRVHHHEKVVLEPFSRACMTVAELDIVWEEFFDKWYSRLVYCFSLSIPVSFLTLVFLAQVKFYMSLSSTWISSAIGVVGIVVWVRFHSPLVAYLMVRHPSTVRADAEARLQQVKEYLDSSHS